MTTLHQRLLNAGACAFGAKRYKGLTNAAAFKRARFPALKWYVDFVLQDEAVGRKAYDLYHGIRRDERGVRLDDRGPRKQRAAFRVLRDRIIESHPALKRA